uniref:Proteasome assembly chaperone 4 n=1 Tax=Homo sapiens TaxID=9606 RepID=F2Z3E0_HUMAN
MSPQLTSAFRNLPKTFVCHLNEMKTNKHTWNMLLFLRSWLHRSTTSPAYHVLVILFEEQGHTDGLHVRSGGSRMFGGSRSKINSARKTNKQVFVSYNLQNTDSNFALLVENRIKEEMEAFPEKF